MKKILGILAIAFLLLPQASEAAKKKKAAKDDIFDVYLLIGQSNMAGRGGLFPSDREDVIDGVFILNDDGEVEPALQPLNRYSSVRVGIKRQWFNLGGPFADAVHRSTGRPILLVVNARGATSARLWLSNAPGLEYHKFDDKWGPKDETPQLFDEAVRRAKMGMKYGKLKAILWHQGESDAYDKYAPLWLDKVASIAEDLRHQLGVSAEEVPFIVGETNHGFSRHEIINNEIHRISQMVPNSTWVSAKDCNITKDKIHFGRSGLILFGRRYAEKVLQMVYGFSAAASVAACSGEVLKVKDLPREPEQGLYTLCDFDNRSVEFTAEGATFSVVGNPKKDNANPSAVVGKLDVKGGGATLSCHVNSPIDLTWDKKLIRLRVMAPKAGSKVSLVLSVAPSKTKETRLREQLAGIGPVCLEAESTGAGVWEDLTFDLSSVQSNFYQEMSFSFPDKGEWFFDNLVIPDDDISPLTLFKQVAPPMLADPDKPWMCNSIANPDVQSPEESIDGNWWLWVRGGDGSKAHLGFYTQPKESFNPLGPWNYNEGNPIVPAGWYGDYDSHHAIDPAPVMTDDGKLILYYKGIDEKRVNRVLLAVTTDGYNYYKTDAPWKVNCGIADIVKWNGKYYMYVARRMYAFTDPYSGDEAQEYEIYEKGDAPDNCDWYSINGGKIFRVKGCDKWFIAYQAGTNNPDFPQRFHVAYSDDMVHWTKVNNKQPLYSRGARGTWDQGAIWAPAIFEYGDSLYMYYEGWGREGYVPNRDRQYFLPAHSQVGIASCKTSDFLSWCGL